MYQFRMFTQQDIIKQQWCIAYLDLSHENSNSSTGIKKTSMIGGVYLAWYFRFFEEKDAELISHVQIVLIIFRSRDVKFTQQFSLSTYVV